MPYKKNGWLVGWTGCSLLACSVMWCTWQLLFCLCCCFCELALNLSPYIFRHPDIANSSVYPHNGNAMCCYMHHSLVPGSWAVTQHWGREGERGRGAGGLRGPAASSPDPRGGWGPRRVHCPSRVCLPSQTTTCSTSSQTITAATETAFTLQASLSQSHPTLSSATATPIFCSAPPAAASKTRPFSLGWCSHWHKRCLHTATQWHPLQQSIRCAVGFSRPRHRRTESKAGKPDLCWRPHSWQRLVVWRTLGCYCFKKGRSNRTISFDVLDCCLWMHIIVAMALSMLLFTISHFLLVCPFCIFWLFEQEKKILLVHYAVCNSVCSQYFNICMQTTFLNLYTNERCWTVGSLRGN